MNFPGSDAFQLRNRSQLTPTQRRLYPIQPPRVGGLQRHSCEVNVLGPTQHTSREGKSITLGKPAFHSKVLQSQNTHKQLPLQWIHLLFWPSPLQAIDSNIIIMLPARSTEQTTQFIIFRSHKKSNSSEIWPVRRIHKSLRRVTQYELVHRFIARSIRLDCEPDQLDFIANQIN